MKRKIDLRKKEEVMQKKRILQMIDEYGKVNEQLKELQVKREEIRKELIDKLGYGVHHGAEYTIEITEKRDPIIDVLKVYKRLGLKRLLKVVSVSITALRKYLTRPEIEELTEDYRVSLMVICRRK